MHTPIKNLDIIIYGGHTLNGLVTIRAIAQAGLKSLVLTHDANAIGLYSTYAHHSLMINDALPSAESLCNIAKSHKIKYIIAHEPKEHEYLMTLSEAGKLPNITVIGQSIRISTAVRDKEYVHNIFTEIKQPIQYYKPIATETEINDIAIHTTYPIIFFNGNSTANHKKLLFARNFIDFKKQTKHIIKQNHTVHLLDKKLYNLPIHQDHYLFSKGEICHIWRSKSYLLPFDQYANHNTISTFHIIKQKKVNMVALDIAKKLALTNDILTIHYFQIPLPDNSLKANYDTNDIFYIDIEVGGFMQNLALFQATPVKIIEERLKIYGLDIKKKPAKLAKYPLLYMNGCTIYQALIHIFDPILKIPLSLFKTTPVFVLCNFHDMNPLLHILWIKIKRTPYILLQLLWRNIKKTIFPKTIQPMKIRKNP